MHEVGHTLGLRHNFRGSAGVTQTQLADRAYTQRHGVGVSVMDYSPAGALARSATAGRLLRAYHRHLRPLGDPLRLRRAGRHPVGAGGEGLRGHRSGLDARRRRSTALRRSRPKRRSRLTCTAPTRTRALAALGLDPTVSRYDQTNDPLELGARAGRPDQRSLRLARHSGGGAGPGLRPAAGGIHRSAERPLVRPPASPPSIWAAPRRLATTGATLTPGPRSSRCPPRASAKHWRSLPRPDSASGPIGSVPTCSAGSAPTAGGTGDRPRGRWADRFPAPQLGHDAAELAAGPAAGPRGAVADSRRGAAGHGPPIHRRPSPSCSPP